MKKRMEDCEKVKIPLFHQNNCALATAVARAQRVTLVRLVVKNPMAAVHAIFGHATFLPQRCLSIFVTL